MQLSEYVAAFGASLADGERKEEVSVNVAGRVSSIRQQGKLIFFDLTGEGVKVVNGRSQQQPRRLPTKATRPSPFWPVHPTVMCHEIRHFTTALTRDPPPPSLQPIALPIIPNDRHHHPTPQTQVQLMTDGATFAEGEAKWTLLVQ
jgi:hypothetical protein